MIFCFYNLGYLTSSANTESNTWKTYLFNEGRLRSPSLTDKLLSLNTIIILIILKARFIAVAKNTEYLFRKEKGGLTPRDYTLMIKGLASTSTELEVRQVFESYQLKNGFPKVYRVNFAYFIQDYMEALTKKNSLVKKIHQASLSQSQDSKILQSLQSQLRTLNLEIEILNRKYQHLKYRKSELFTGVCFITFNSIKDREEVLERWKLGNLAKIVLKYFGFMKNCFKHGTEKFKGQTIFVEEPPEPCDIIWENLGTSSTKKVLTRIWTFLLSLVILAGSFVAILSIKKYQITNLENLGSSWRKYFSSTLIFLVIFVINEVLHLTLRQICAYEKYSTLSSFHTAVAKRLSTSMWVNSCLMLVFANYLVHGDEMKNKIDQQGGLIYDVVFVLLGSVFVTPLSRFVQIDHIYRFFVKRSIRNQGVLSKLTQ